MHPFDFSNFWMIGSFELSNHGTASFFFFLLSPLHNFSFTSFFYSAKGTKGGKKRVHFEFFLSPISGDTLGLSFCCCLRPLGGSGSDQPNEPINRQPWV